MTEEMKYYTGNCITDLHTDTSISYCNEEKCKQYIKSDGLKFCMSSVCLEKDCIYALVNKLHQKIDSLEQENKELKMQNESQKGLITVGGKQQYQYLQRIDELEQENRKLKKDVQLFKCLDTFGESECHCACRCLGNEFCEDADKKINNYRSALGEINRIVKLAHKVEDYLLGQDYTDLVDRIENKINEVLNENSSNRQQ